MSGIVYEMTPFSRDIAYKNLLGEEKKVTLYFALDPIHLMQELSTFRPKKSRSGNPAKADEVSDEDQLKFIRRLAAAAAGIPSSDGETWIPDEEFADQVYGKAFMTKLAASDGDRKEFSEKVILEPMRAFVDFAKADPSNSAKDIQDFERTMAEMEKLFRLPTLDDESVEDRRARLQREMDALNQTSE